jgi:hypothetical protein
MGEVPTNHHVRVWAGRQCPRLYAEVIEQWARFPRTITCAFGLAGAPHLRECNRRDPVLMSSQWPNHNVLCLGIPHPNCLVIRARDNALAIWRECNRRNPVLCPSNGPDHDVTLSQHPTPELSCHQSPRQCACHLARMQQT